MALNSNNLNKLDDEKMLDKLKTSNSTMSNTIRLIDIVYGFIN